MQRVVGVTLSSPSRAGNLFTAIFRASSRKVLNVLNALTLARKGGSNPAPLRFFADYAPPGFGLPYGANLAQFLASKI